MARTRHPKPEVEEAIRYAEEHGWHLEAGRSHWGILMCPFFKDADSTCGPCAEWCKTSIWATPKNPGTFAKQVRRKIDRCLKHQAKSEDDDDE